MRECFSHYRGPSRGHFGGSRRLLEGSSSNSHLHFPLDGGPRLDLRFVSVWRGQPLDLGLNQRFCTAGSRRTSVVSVPGLSMSSATPPQYRSTVLLAWTQDVTSMLSLAVLLVRNEGRAVSLRRAIARVRSFFSLRKEENTGAYPGILRLPLFRSKLVGSSRVWTLVPHSISGLGLVNL